MFNKLESDHGLDGVLDEDMIGEEIKGLDLQFYYKEKWQSLGDTEMIDFQICKNYCVGTRLVGYGRVKQK